MMREGRATVLDVRLHRAEAKHARAVARMVFHSNTRAAHAMKSPVCRTSAKVDRSWLRNGVGSRVA
jgi:hypothetical protein